MYRKILQNMNASPSIGVPPLSTTNVESSNLSGKTATFKKDIGSVIIAAN